MGLHVLKDTFFFFFNRKSPVVLKNRYQIVVYTCNEEYALKNPDQDRLYCSQGAWLGSLPECVQKEGKAWIWIKKKS